MPNKIPAPEIYEAPSIEPVTLDDVKAYLRIDGDNENDSIIAMISASRIVAEKYMRASIIYQKWKLSFDNISLQEVMLPYGPVVAVDSVKAIDLSGTVTVFDTANYYLTSGNLSIFFREIPSAQRIEIIYSTGFGDSVDDVPALIKQGILADVASIYERKLMTGDVSETAKNLYNVYRNIKI